MSFLHLKRIENSLHILFLEMPRSLWRFRTYLRFWNMEFLCQKLPKTKGLKKGSLLVVGLPGREAWGETWVPVYEHSWHIMEDKPELHAVRHSVHSPNIDWAGTVLHFGTSEKIIYCSRNIEHTHQFIRKQWQQLSQTLIEKMCDSSSSPVLQCLTQWWKTPLTATRASPYENSVAKWSWLSQKSQTEMEEYK